MHCHMLHEKSSKEVMRVNDCLELKLTKRVGRMMIARRWIIARIFEVNRVKNGNRIEVELENIEDRSGKREHPLLQDESYHQRLKKV